MNLGEFCDAVSHARVLLIGERHSYIGDTAMLVTLANAFVRTGRKPVFLFEHFPGRTINNALRAAVKTEVEEGNWDAINTFLKSKLEIGGEGSKSPLEAWGHPEQEWRLKVLLRYAQINGLIVGGHDLPFGKQNEIAQSEGMTAWQEARDAKMVRIVGNALRKFPTSAIFCFVGQQHIDPQLLLIAMTESKVVSLRPARDFDYRHPATVTTVTFTRTAGNSYTYNMP